MFGTMVVLSFVRIQTLVSVDKAHILLRALLAVLYRTQEDGELKPTLVGLVTNMM
jgi:hypothetical protein